ncbi:Phospholipase D [Andreprevotia sp. IGB-42]|uniref:alkaline phosphatase D family protein n=1 Tax=Andreprevotia sp. IGB-42 TaxID=2497473 RepID=UPI0013568FBE|nr:alkaline phosphatase D family protein [Andreprevotia sp. IGB-42]KAF0811415.1 Phospholipase D [Andreprevotia sp. IGB-42]
MDRRHFLKLGGFVTVSIAGAGLAGCNSDAAPELPPTQSTVSGPDWKFPQSVASGDPRPDGILLWARVVPLAADDVASSASGDITIRLRISEADYAGSLGSNATISNNLVLDTTVPVKAAYDHTVRHKVSGLLPGKTYYYQFVAGDVRSRVGRFKTAPARDADVAQLKLAFLSCQDWSINHWGAYEQIASTETLDFIVHLGDYIYETVGDDFQRGAVEARHPALQLPNGTLRAGSSAKYATTLTDYRYLYKRYRTDTRLQAVHERFPFIAVWDDHEFSDDCWGDAETYENGSASATGADNVHQLQRRRSANQAWFEFMPADVYFNDTATTSFDTIRIYRELQFGKLAHLVMTDERLYRSDHIIPEAAINPASGQQLGSIGSRYMVPESTLAALEAQKRSAGSQQGDELALVSVLGRTQRDWWKQTMQASSATWKLWGNEVSLLKMGIDGSKAIATLVALNVVPTLAGNIASTAALVAGNNLLAAAIVAAVAAGATQLAASAGATAIATQDALGASQSARIGAAVTAGLSVQQAGLATQAYDAAKAAALAGGTASQQQQAGALRIAELLTGKTGAPAVFAAVQADIVANKQASSFVPDAMKVALAPFFDRFVLNADQWDGYNAERKALMQHLAGNNIRNVVALTGDIHAFYAGTVQADYNAATLTPVMVDLVTAGVSSDSFFNYLRQAVGGMSSSLATLVYYPLVVPVAGLGNVNLNVNLLDYTLKPGTVTAASLAESLRVQLRGALAAKGVTVAQLDATTGAVLAALQTDAGFTGQLLPLAQTLAALGSNPWLALANTDAQGYAVVTLTLGQLRCEFRQVNRLVGGNAPAQIVAGTVVAIVDKDVAAVRIG